MRYKKIVLIFWMMVSLSGLVFADQIDDLARNARSSDFSTRWDAVHALGQIKDPKAVDALIKLLSESDAVTRQNAAEALGNSSGPLDPKAVDPLIKVLKTDSDSMVRWKAANALGYLKDERALEPLIAALNDSSEHVREWSLDALKTLAQEGKKNPRAVDESLRLLNDSVSGVRDSAALALGAYGDPRAVDPLIYALGDPDYLVRAFAASALGTLGDKKAIDALRPLILESDQTVRGYAANALRELGASGETVEKEGKLREALDQYTAELAANTWNENLRKKIIEVASKLDPPPAIPEEAKRGMGRGKAAFQSAQNPGEYQKAREEFEKAVNLAPWWADGYYNLALVEEQERKFDQALSHLKLYLLAAPNAPDKSQIEEKIYGLEYSGEQARKADESFTRGENFRVAKNYASAEAEYREALRLDPKDGQAHSMLGQTLARLDRFEEALQELKEGLRLGYKDPWSYSFIGWIYSEKAIDHDEAIKYLEEGIRLYPFHPENGVMYTNLGYSYEAKGNYEKALQAFESALRAGVDDPSWSQKKIDEMKRRLGR